MTKQTITFRTEKTKQLDDLATSLGQNRSAIIEQAIDIILDVYSWQKKHITQGLKQAENQDFVEESDWKQAFNKNRK